jgi:hypothetical protein
VVTCDGCSDLRHGYPNDEGPPEHPLYAKGLDRELRSMRCSTRPGTSGVMPWGIDQPGGFIVSTMKGHTGWAPEKDGGPH